MRPSRPGLTTTGAIQPAPFGLLAAPAWAGAGGLLLGLATGAAREHSGSVLPAFALHAVAAAGLLAAALLG